MRFFEFTTPSPEQTKINTLKQQKERSSTALKTEKDRQKRAKALAGIAKNNQVLAKL